MKAIKIETTIYISKIYCFYRIHDLMTESLSTSKELNCDDDLMLI